MTDRLQSASHLPPRLCGCADHTPSTSIARSLLLAIGFLTLGAAIVAGFAVTINKLVPDSPAPLHPTPTKQLQDALEENRKLMLLLDECRRREAQQPIRSTPAVRDTTITIPIPPVPVPIPEPLPKRLPDIQ